MQTNLAKPDFDAIIVDSGNSQCPGGLSPLPIKREGVDPG
jgi:hypothetical protein